MADMGKKYDMLDRLIKKTIVNNEDISDPESIAIAGVPRPDVVYYGIKQVIGFNEKRKRFWIKVLAGIIIAIIMVALPIHLYPRSQASDIQEHLEMLSGEQPPSVTETTTDSDQDEMQEKGYRREWRFTLDAEEQE